jgi:hypothetical protein
VTTNPLSMGRKALVQRLMSVTAANGYFTNAGANVKTGWLNEVLKSDDLGFPLIVVQKAKDLPPIKGPSGQICKVGFYVIGAVNAGLDAYEDALDDIQLDLQRALIAAENHRPTWLPQKAGIISVTLGAPEQFPPGNGEQAATVLIPVHLHTIIER